MPSEVHRPPHPTPRPWPRPLVHAPLPLKLIGRPALTDRSCSESAQPGLCCLSDPLTSAPWAGCPALTVLEAQDDVPQVEASLLLREGLVTGHFHDGPMEKDAGGAFSRNQGTRPFRRSGRPGKPVPTWVPRTQDISFFCYIIKNVKHTYSYISHFNHNFKSAFS